MNECMFNDTQHEKQIGYWMSEQGKCMKWLAEQRKRLLLFKNGWMDGWMGGYKVGGWMDGWV